MDSPQSFPKCLRKFAWPVDPSSPTPASTSDTVPDGARDATADTGEFDALPLWTGSLPWPKRRDDVVPVDIAATEREAVVGLGLDYSVLKCVDCGRANVYLHRLGQSPTLDAQDYCEACQQTRADRRARRVDVVLLVLLAVAAAMSGVAASLVWDTLRNLFRVLGHR